MIDVICPHCQSPESVRRGLRKNRAETVQLYLCKNPECGRTFTFVPREIRAKKFPLSIIIEAVSYYNLGFTLEQTCSLIEQKFKISPDPRTLFEWLKETSPLCRFERLRPWALKLCKPEEMVEVTTMAHRQLFRFRYHRAKMALALEEFKNRRFGPLKDYLDAVSAETPHQYFQEGERMSEIRSRFDKSGMIVRSKKNFANRLAVFVIQAVKSNKDRHEQLQRFMIANDSCTVATEVPVYIRKEDIEHMEGQLNFKIVGRPSADIEPRRVEQRSRKPGGDGFIIIKGKKKKELPRLLTGHIDLVQVRNGQVHLLDYKPKAAKEQPIEQLTWYAMALSRLTGLRLYEFKCGWFDEKDYFEFYPLHVVYKLKTRKRKRFGLKSGIVVEIPDEAEGNRPKFV